MKTKNLFAASVLCLAGNFAIGAVLTVDNNPTSNAQYSSIPAAIDAANDFDTLLVQPSALDYGNIYINKPLFVIGRGHNASFGRVWTTYIQVESSGVVIEGIYADQNGIYISPSHSEIVIRNCSVQSLLFAGNNSNIIITGCEIKNFSPISQTLSNILVLNNIIDKLFQGVLVGDCETIIFKNNIILTNAAIFNSSSAFAVFTDNIFYVQGSTTNFNPDECTSCNFQNNLTYRPAGTLPLLPNSTLNNVAPTWNLNGLNSPAFNYSINYEMLSGAPATGASDGGQVGIYGAGFNFEMNGFPVGIPRVTYTNIVNPVVFPDGEIEVDFEAEAGSN